MPVIIDVEPRRGTAGRVNQIRQQNAPGDDHARYYTTQSGKVLSRTGKVLEILQPPAPDDGDGEFELEFESKAAAGIGAKHMKEESPSDERCSERKEAVSATPVGLPRHRTSGPSIAVRRETQLRKQRERILALEEELADANERRDRTDASLRKQRERRKAVEAELAEANARLEALEAELAAVVEQRDEAQERREALEKELAEANGQRELAETQLLRKQRERRKALEGDLDKVGARIGEQEAALVGAAEQRVAAHERHRELEAELAVAVHRLSALESELNATTGRWDEARRLLEGARAAAALAEQRADQLERDCRATVRRQKEQMQGRIEEERSRLSQTLAELENDRCRWRGLVETLQAGQNRTQGEFQRERHRAEVLQTELQRERRDSAALRDEITKNDKVHKEVTAMMSEKYNSALEESRRSKEELQRVQAQMQDLRRSLEDKDVQLEEKDSELEEKDLRIQALKRERNSRLPISLDREPSCSSAPAALSPLRQKALALASAPDPLERHTFTRERRPRRDRVERESPPRSQSQLDRELRQLLESNAKFRDAPLGGSLCRARASLPREAQDDSSPALDRLPLPMEEDKAARRRPKRKNSPASEPLAPRPSLSSSPAVQPEDAVPVPVPAFSPLPKRRSPLPAAEPSVLMQLPPPPPGRAPKSAVEPDGGRPTKLVRRTPTAASSPQ